MIFNFVQTKVLVLFFMPSIVKSSVEKPVFGFKNFKDVLAPEPVLFLMVTH